MPFRAGKKQEKKKKERKNFSKKIISFVKKINYEIF